MGGADLPALRILDEMPADPSIGLRLNGIDTASYCKSPDATGAPPALGI